MDSIGERLKDLILYVNQNSQFDVYAVQLEYYKFEDYEIVIPNLFGVEVKKSINISSSGQKSERLSNFDFLKSGILVGEELTYCKDPNIKVKVLDNKNIEFNGKPRSLSSAAREIRVNMGNNDHVLQGPVYWKYKGEILNDRRKRMRNKTKTLNFDE